MTRTKRTTMNDNALLQVEEAPASDNGRQSQSFGYESFCLE